MNLGLFATESSQIPSTSRSTDVPTVAPFATLLSPSTTEDHLEAYMSAQIHALPLSHPLIAHVEEPAGQHIKCGILSPHGYKCNAIITLRPDGINVLRGHLRDTHELSRSTGNETMPCPWADCQCLDTRCPNKLTPHAAHPADLAAHIWRAHLGFRWTCNICRRAEWNSPFALERHRRTCSGLESVRCALCCEEFPSQAQLNTHVANRVCPFL
jgi:hypothetical protein